MATGTGPQSFLHMDRRKRDLTLSLSFSLFLIRGNIFSAAVSQQKRPCEQEGRGDGGGGVRDASRERQREREGKVREDEVGKGRKE